MLDRDFRVRSVRGLGVIDLSAIPVLPACHLQVSIHALTKYAATVLAVDLLLVSSVNFPWLIQGSLRGTYLYPAL